MTKFTLGACLVLACVGCQKGEGDAPASGQSVRAAPPGSEYAKDIEALCDVMTRANAPDDDSRTLIVANWLAANLKTPESRQFLIKIQPLGGNDKAAALEAEAKRVGLSGCALAAEWRTP
ncbi:MAG TPA: hypothetical protein VM513_02300 [Kofleriaceae bacterium]|jgi:hypothetical protein|nr:hypothetical protein [Kofleriaceae bacterium]